MPQSTVYFFECECGNFTICKKTEEQLHMEIINHYKYCKETGISTTHEPSSPDEILSQQEIDDLKEKICIFKMYSTDY